eukprot:scaffold132645_cov18-Tisochrysis_lutea.AAC.3
MKSRQSAIKRCSRLNISYERFRVSASYCPSICHVQKGQAVHTQDVQPAQHFTRPPPRYTEASLIKALEELGIGRPSTYASTLKLLQDLLAVLCLCLTSIRPQDKCSIHGMSNKLLCAFNVACCYLKPAHAPMRLVVPDCTTKHVHVSKNPSQHGADMRLHHQAGAGPGPLISLYTTYGTLTTWCRHAATSPRRGGPWPPHNM